MGSLFEDEAVGSDSGTPLAARMRPRTFDEYVGQTHLTGPDTPFRRAAEAGKLGSILLWGPPGVGKTTLAEIVARASGSSIVKLSATSSGVADIRKATEEARYRRARGQKTVLFIDEIHRFNKSQQDAVLPVVEDGTVSLIGATTENPSFEVNSALLSRMRVFTLLALEDGELARVMEQALHDRERGIKAVIEPEAQDAMVNLANGDARTALNLLELGVGASDGHITLDVVKAVAQRQLLYDKSGDMHFDLISALHKSVRDSDIDASLYWLGRMIESGEDPLYLARRLIRMATEDIGLADPHALTLAMAAQQAVHFMGVTEGALALAQITSYLAAAPKSNALYTAYGAVRKDLEEMRNDPVPMHLRNAPTKLMREQGFGEGYKYAHDYEGAVVEQEHLPERLKGRKYYTPTDRGFEAKIQARIEARKKA